MRIVSCPPSDGGGGGGGALVLSSAGIAQASTAEASTRSRGLGVMLRVHILQRTLARRHLLAALRGCFRGSLNLGRDRRFDLRELLHRDPIRLQVFLVHPDRIPFAPMLDQRRWEGGAG